jgi:putative NIF3 family GTP cyclohydrolase 1 type 2
MNRISRRKFVMLAAAGSAVVPFTTDLHVAYGQGTLTAQAIVDRIQQKSGGEWKPDTVDTFKAGDPATVVKGVVITAMATIGVLRQAVQSGANLVITCEPSFYSKADSATPAAGRGGTAAAPDPVFAAKNDFIKSNRLVIWRFSDHWRQRTPDPLAIGLTDALGWTRFRAADNPALVSIPATSLDNLASDLQKKLNARGGIRVVGDPQLKVQKIGLLPGTTAIQAALKLLPQVDVIIAGEVREWESVEYVRDKVTAGEKKSLILLGRVVSEDAGMNECAKWVKTVVPEVPTKWVPVDDPYWRPV